MQAKKPEIIGNSWEKPGEETVAVGTRDTGREALKTITPETL